MGSLVTDHALFTTLTVIIGLMMTARIGAVLSVKSIYELTRKSTFATALNNIVNTIAKV